MKLKNYIIRLRRKRINYPIYYIFIILGLTFFGCSSYSKFPKPSYNPEIPMNTLTDRGIVPMNSNYKSRYPDLLSYLFYNDNGRFNKISGDFFNLSHPKLSEVNIMPGYWKDYGEFKKCLIVLIAMTPSSTFSLRSLAITVTSSQHGLLLKEELKKPHQLDIVQQIQLFVKKIEIENDWNILDKVNDDVITVTIGNTSYNFLNPEIKLKYINL